MKRFPVLPAATFAVALLLSALLPAARHTLRADGEGTGCKVTATVNGKASAETVTVGKDSIRDKDKKGARQGLEQGFKKLKTDVSDPDTSKSLDDTIDEVFEEKFDAVTVALYSFGIDGIQKAATVWTVTGSFDASIVILLPKDADETLTNHELGHKLIAEKTVEYAKKKIKEEVEKAACDEAAIEAAFNAAAAAAVEVGNKANKDYDEKTDHGRKGGAAGQLPQAAASFAAAAGG